MTKKSTEVATRKENAVPDLASMAKGLRKTKQQVPRGGGKPYLKFGKDGAWNLGRDGDAFVDELAVLNPLTLKSGFVCWTDYDKEELKKKKKNEKLGDEMELISRGGVDYDSLPDTGWDWKQQLSIEGRMLHGDQKDFVYTASSQGAMDAFGEIIDEIDTRIEEGEEVYLFPVTQLGSTWYMHPTWGKTYKPVVEILGWADVNGETENDIEAKTTEHEDETEEAPEEKEPPKRQRRAAKAKEPEPEPEDEGEDDSADEQEEAEQPPAEGPPRRRRRR